MGINDKPAVTQNPRWNFVLKNRIDWISSMATNFVDDTPKGKPWVSLLIVSLQRLNSEYGKVVPGLGTTPLMGVFMALFAVFIVIILEIYSLPILHCCNSWGLVIDSVFIFISSSQTNSTFSSE